MLDRVVCVTSFTDPAMEPDRLRHLYDAMADARRGTGEAPVPFESFAALVREQVRVLGGGVGEVAFRVAVREGRVSLTARVLGGVEPDSN